MYSSSARSGGIAISMVPSSRYVLATRRCVSTMTSTESAYTSASCSSGFSISGVNTVSGCRKMRPKNVVTKRWLMR